MENLDMKLGVVAIFILFNTFLIFTGIHFVLRGIEEIKEHIGMKR